MDVAFCAAATSETDSKIAKKMIDRFISTHGGVSLSMFEATPYYLFPL
jgi:hypothetical protein